jgi:hypothetical protein
LRTPITTGFPPETFLVPAASAAASPDPLDEVAAGAAPVPVALAPALLEPLLEQPAITSEPAIAGTAMTRAERPRLVDLWVDPMLDRIGLSFEDVEAARTIAPRCDSVGYGAPGRLAAGWAAGADTSRRAPGRTTCGRGSSV